jgi:predicted protein tyrosine phosphatase
MNFDPIDTPLPGLGSIWQGGAVDADGLNQIPGPLAIVCMDAGEQNDTFISHPRVEAVLSVWIDDSPDAALSDDTYCALIDMAVAWLHRPGNLYIHCAAGVSRASYFDIGLHMRLLHLPYDGAYSLVKTHRPVASPNSGFIAHLRHLEARLIAS